MPSKTTPNSIVSTDVRWRFLLWKYITSKRPTGYHYRYQEIMWNVKWEKKLIPLKTHLQISLELHTCRGGFQEWQNVCPWRAYSKHACHCLSQGTTDVTKWANKGQGGFCGDINLNNMVLCAVNQQLGRPDIFLLFQYLLQRPPVQAHIGRNISQQLSETRNSDSTLQLPPQISVGSRSGGWRILLWDYGLWTTKLAYPEN